MHTPTRQAQAGLVLVDLQNDFCTGGSLPVPHGEAVVPVVNRLLLESGFQVIVATQDWHPLDHISFAANHPGETVGSTIRVGSFEQVLWPVHCVQKSPGAALLEAVHTDAIRKIFHKGTDPHIDSYSCFFDNRHQRSTGMGEFLALQGVESVYLLGLATDYCVKFSALDAIGLGFETYVIVDGCRGIDLRSGDVDAALKEMQESGVHLIQSPDLLPGRRTASGPTMG